jgi:hypothetical protein
MTERERCSILCGTVPEDEIPHLLEYMSTIGREVTLHYDQGDGTIYWDAQKKSTEMKLIDTANRAFQA